jgi:histone chaperone ASF1
LEWKVIYVGSAEDSSHDQVLEEVMVGPVAVGINRFVLQAEPPNPRLIANEDLIGVTVILITCSYMDHKFVQIGYYVNNEYALQYDPENYPNPVDITHLYRNILADQPRVTRYPIDWMGGGLPTGADVFDGQEEQKFAADNQNYDVSSIYFVLMYVNDIDNCI